MAYIYPAPGVTNVESTLKIHKTSKAVDATGLLIPALQDMTINAANDVFTWTQLDETAKLQIATTSTNSISMNIVLDQTTFFGTTGSGGSTAAAAGIFGLSVDKSKWYLIYILATQTQVVQARSSAAQVISLD